MTNTSGSDITRRFLPRLGGGEGVIAGPDAILEGLGIAGGFGSIVLGGRRRFGGIVFRGPLPGTEVRLGVPETTSLENVHSKENDCYCLETYANVL